MTYRAPINDMLLALNHGAGPAGRREGRPLRRFRRRHHRRRAGGSRQVRHRRAGAAQPVGDEHGIKLDDGKVTTAPGWPDAYQRWTAAGLERGVGAGSISAARACRSRSTPPAPKSGARRISPSASARC